MTAANEQEQDKEGVKCSQEETKCIVNDKFYFVYGI